MFENETSFRRVGLICSRLPLFRQTLSLESIECDVMSLSSVVGDGRCGYWEAAPQTGVVISAAQS